MQTEILIAIDDPELASLRVTCVTGSFRAHEGVEVPNVPVGCAAMIDVLEKWIKRGEAR